MLTIATIVNYHFITSMLNVTWKDVLKIVYKCLSLPPVLNAVRTLFYSNVASSKLYINKVLNYIWKTGGIIEDLFAILKYYFISIVISCFQLNIKNHNIVNYRFITYILKVTWKDILKINSIQIFKYTPGLKI